jgi:two-component system chemotaxis family response regulator WspR
MFAPHADIDIVCCSEPDNALKTVRAVRPTVILQCLGVPVDAGLKLIETFRSSAECEAIPIVVLSAGAEAATKKAAFAAGANDYFIELPDELEMISRIRYHSASFLAHRDLQRAVDELNKTRDQLFQSEKMASMGLLAAGVAHEINNPIAFVTSNLNSLSGYHRDVFSVLDAAAALK